MINEVELKIEDFLDYRRNFTTKTFDDIYNEVKKYLSQGYVNLYGKTFAEPRLNTVFTRKESSFTYSYSNSGNKKLYLVQKHIQDLFDLLEKEVDSFDFVLVNYYRNGLDKIGWHSDREKNFNNVSIASISFGEERKFQIREIGKTSGPLVWEKKLESGSLVWMKNKHQNYYKHQVPVQKNITKPRLNLTFRKIG